MCIHLLILYQLMLNQCSYPEYLLLYLSHFLYNTIHALANILSHLFTYNYVLSACKVPKIFSGVRNTRVNKTDNTDQKIQ